MATIAATTPSIPLSSYSLLFALLCSSENTSLLLLPNTKKIHDAHERASQNSIHRDDDDDEIQRQAPCQCVSAAHCLLLPFLRDGSAALLIQGEPSFPPFFLRHQIPTFRSIDGPILPAVIRSRDAPIRSRPGAAGFGRRFNGEIATEWPRIRKN